MRVSVLVCLVSIIILVGAFGAEEQIVEDPTVRIAVSQKYIGSFDPHATLHNLDVSVIKQIFEGLLTFEPGTVSLETLKPSLAVAWEVSEDSRVWTFHLRRGVKWHHGYGEFTAEDVAFSIERVKTSPVSIYSDAFENVEKVEVVDDYTVRVYSKTPDPWFGLKVVDYQSGYIVCKRAFEELGDSGFATTPIGTGPFQLKSVYPGEKVVLERFPEYWGGVPKIKRLEFYLVVSPTARVMGLLAGEYDVAHHIYGKAVHEKLVGAGMKFARNLPTGNVLHFNLTIKPFDDIRVRRALVHAINREVFLDYYGRDLAEPMYAPVPDAYIGAAKDVKRYEYNPEKAKELLAEAGYPDGFAFSTIMTHSADHRVPLELVQDMWRQVGVDMHIEIVEHTTWHVKIRENQAPVVTYNAARLPYPGPYLKQFYYGPSACIAPTTISNFSNYDGADEFIRRGDTAKTLEESVYWWEQAQKKIMEDLPVYPLVQTYNAVYYRPTLHLGYEPNLIMEYMIKFTPDSYVTKE